MKKIFLFFLFPLFIHAQLSKPSNVKGAIVSDSLQLKYVKGDSTNLKSNYNSLVNDTSYYNSIGLGLSTLGNWNSGTLNNVIGIGQAAGYTVSNNTAARNLNNVFIGQYAGYMDFGLSPIVTFAHNIMIGDDAGRSAFQGSTANQNYNNMFGYYAGYQLTNGIQNNLFGYSSGYQWTVSYSNLIGSNPNQYPGGGYFNNYIGYNNGGNNTGDYNNWFGNNISSSSALILNHTLIEGNSPYISPTTATGLWIVSDGAYYPSSNFWTGDFIHHTIDFNGSMTIDTNLTVNGSTNLGNAFRVDSVALKTSPQTINTTTTFIKLSNNPNDFVTLTNDSTLTANYNGTYLFSFYQNYGTTPTGSENLFSILKNSSNIGYTAIVGIGTITMFSQIIKLNKNDTVQFTAQIQGTNFSDVISTFQLSIIKFP